MSTKIASDTQGLDENWPLPAERALIVWDDPDDRFPLGRVAVGSTDAQNPVPNDSKGYRYSGGAAYVERRNLSGKSQYRYVLEDFYTLSCVYGIRPHIVHLAFCNIAEFQDLTVEMGFGPDVGEPGHRPDRGFGRCVSNKPPLKTATYRGFRHVWFIREDAE